MDNNDFRKNTMKLVKSKGTQIELLLAKSLWNLGYRYRKNDKTVFGKPDLTLKRFKIAIFVDGEFWHGKDWEIRKHDHKTNQAFWHAKIERNIQRDKEVTEKLTSDGWKVLRFWGDDVTKNLRTCIDIITNTINETKELNQHK